MKTHAVAFLVGRGRITETMPTPRLVRGRRSATPRARKPTLTDGPGVAAHVEASAPSKTAMDFVHAVHGQRG